MNRKIRLLSLLILAVVAPTARAAVFERYWKAPGDGLLTYDDVNQREWLDVPQSLLANFPGIDLEIRYQSVVAQTTAGGMFEGFTVAKSDDVIALAQSAGIDVSTTSLAVNETATRHLIELLGKTVELSGGRVSTTGAIDDLTATTPMTRLVGNFTVTPQQDKASIAVIPSSSIGIDRPATIIGVMLFRPIPEPRPAFMALFGALYFLGHSVRATRR